ncbi:MAG: proline--tRNA ligase [Bdellovibrionaceae bacterium]|nr:proline--tRNA ligase [Pseudobdellovibrionaceae bacterium]|tara:strand:+ start:11947 stop:13677 length:1731 start_codon:yes stop_codon:yes gene_type:complete
MRWSKAHLFTQKETPADAEIASHKLMLRAGLIKKVTPGIYTLGFMALKAQRKFESILREEFEKDGLIEILMPVVHPAELWQETNRWTEMGDGLARFKNRNGQEFCLGATHEEVITDYVRHDLKSYRDLPVIIYQIQTKFRDEIRPRFGLMRGREFTMKDAYSFDVDRDAALDSYDLMHAAYKRAFDRLGLDYRIVKADSGNIGGDKSEEFHVIADSGEDSLMVSTESEFAANSEVCPAIDVEDVVYGGTEELALEEFPTPGLRSIADLSKATNTEEKFLVKTMFYSVTDDQSKDGLSPIAVCLRGDDEVNPIKIKNHFGLANPAELLTDEEVKQITGASPGSCGPVGINIPIYFDNGLKHFKNFVVGANKDDFHLKNVNTGRDFQLKEWVDFRMAKEGDKSPDGKGLLKEVRGIEVGHIFYLGTKYSKAMKATFLDKNGKAQLIEMGCYGIGVGRTVQAAIEQSHDEDGVVWPRALAPFDVHICHLDPKDEKVDEVVQDIEAGLQGLGIDVFVDDRKERPGVKFKDADLIGFPLRITVGGRGVSNGEVEVFHRASKEKESLPIAEVVSKVGMLLNN